MRRCCGARPWGYSGAGRRGWRQLPDPERIDRGIQEADPVLPLSLGLGRRARRSPPVAARRGSCRRDVARSTRSRRRAGVQPASIERVAADLERCAGEHARAWGRRPSEMSGITRCAVAECDCGPSAVVVRRGDRVGHDAGLVGGLREEEADAAARPVLELRWPRRPRAAGHERCRSPRPVLFLKAWLV